MSIFNPSLLLHRLKNFKYKNQFPIGSIYPSQRRSVVLVLLFIGGKGELRVLLTKRSRGLRSFSGHVSLPGGKADNDFELFEEVARREAEEEIGLPRDAETLKSKFGMGVENILTHTPFYLSTTFLSVRPMVCFLYNDTGSSDPEVKYKIPLNVSSFFGKLNPGETSSIFSIPLVDIAAHLLPPKINYKPEYIKRTKNTKNWGGLDWNISHYHYPSDNPKEEKWLSEISDSSSGDEIENGLKYRDVWGLTAKILYDISRISLEYVDNKDKNIILGEEQVIYGLYEYGKQMRPGKRSDWELNMLSGKRKVQFSDVLPESYLKTIESPSDNDDNA